MVWLNEGGGGSEGDERVRVDGCYKRTQIVCIQKWISKEKPAYRNFVPMWNHFKITFAYLLCLEGVETEKL